VDAARMLKKYGVSIVRVDAARTLNATERKFVEQHATDIFQKLVVVEEDGKERVKNFNEGRQRRMVTEDVIDRERSSASAAGAAAAQSLHSTIDALQTALRSSACAASSILSSYVMEGSSVLFNAPPEDGFQPAPQTPHYDVHKKVDGKYDDNPEAHLSILFNASTNCNVVLHVFVNSHRLMQQYWQEFRAEIAKVQQQGSAAEALGIARKVLELCADDGDIKEDLERLVSLLETQQQQQQLSDAELFAISKIVDERIATTLCRDLVLVDIIIPPKHAAIFNDIHAGAAAEQDAKGHRIFMHARKRVQVDEDDDEAEAASTDYRGTYSVSNCVPGFSTAMINESLPVIPAEAARTTNIDAHEISDDDDAAMQQQLDLTTAFKSIPAAVAQDIRRKLSSQEALQHIVTEQLQDRQMISLAVLDVERARMEMGRASSSSFRVIMACAETIQDAQHVLSSSATPKFKSLWLQHLALQLSISRGGAADRVLFVLHANYHSALLRIDLSSPDAAGARSASLQIYDSLRTGLDEHGVKQRWEHCVNTVRLLLQSANVSIASESADCTFCVQARGSNECCIFVILLIRALQAKNPAHAIALTVTQSNAVKAREEIRGWWQQLIDGNSDVAREKDAVVRFFEML
jgi:hypothetical protein